ncbi:MAG: calcium-binding protein [Myxococcales bacterium]|nr:calcium-binding protein [Myxococcales bacterium]
MRRRAPSWTLFALLLPALSCTDAGLYAVGGRGQAGPDRAEFVGKACVPMAAGDSFPVKVLYAVEGGQGVDQLVKGQIADALQSLSSRFSVPYITFALVAYHTVATGIQGSFVDAAKIQLAIGTYTNYQEAGPISLRAPLKLAKSMLSGDMQTGCRGTVARTRYLVVLIYSTADTSCANPAFNAGLDSRCTKYLPDQAACSACELTAVTAQLKNLAEQYLAGEVTIQPIYVRTTPDPVARAQGAAIARSGGTELVETDPASLKNTINALNYASLQRSLTLKRLIAYNRSAVSRAGEQMVDSDGDGLPDDDEAALGLDPVAMDSDLDGLMDGIEVRMGMPPNAVDVINGCNPFLDTDGDRLNDCEERVLGTDACISDSDGDGIPELVELLSRTNPLIAEDLDDADRDGLSNVAEIEAHTDPSSADLAYRSDRGYGYVIADADPTEDGRPCYDIEIYNVSLVPTLERPNPPFPNIPRGTNDIYIYLQVGRENDPRGTGIGSLLIEQIQFIPPNKRKPKGIIQMAPDQFVLGS